MIHICKKIIIVLVVIILADKVLSYVFMNSIFKQTLSGESGGTINYVINEKNNLDFLVIGASRAKHGIDPSLLTSLGTSSYNLGINGTTVLHGMLVLDILMQNGVKMKTLVLSTDLSDYTSSSNEKILDQIKRVYPYDTKLIREYVDHFGFVEQTKYFFDFYKLNRKMLNISYNFLKKDSIKNITGYVGLPSIKEKPDTKSISEGYIYESTGTGAEAIKRIEKICNENNIRLMVVFPPSYNNVFYNKIQQKYMMEDFKKNGITNIIDLSDIHMSPSLANEENWRDAVHFNTTGSQKFSHILNEKISKRKF